ncbi:hypothetical protein [Streptomyces sp. NPDC008121]|uniref:hypothetical protein n=1 Tax=Streptomyces sp. NPDC008121 TaxID=3364809 RepID=UPI0036EB11FE
MGSQDQHKGPDYPPVPEPGESVLAAMKVYGLSEQDWKNFLREVDRCLKWSQKRIDAKRRFDVNGHVPFWDDKFSNVLREAAKRLRRLTVREQLDSRTGLPGSADPKDHPHPHWILLEKYAEELEVKACKSP